MKRTILLVLFVLLLGLLVAESSAVEVSVFGPVRYVRTEGAKDVYRGEFSANPGDGKLIVKNGNYCGDRRIEDSVSSASVCVNGEQIFGPNDFNKNSYLQEASVNLNETNTLVVELASKPDSYITVQVIAEVDPPTVTMTANPNSIVAGESAVLSWSSTNCHCITIDQGIGDVDLCGSIPVSPAVTTTYTITAVGPAGIATDQTMITVTGGGAEPQPEGSFGQRYEDLIPPDATAESYDPRRFSVITGLVRSANDTPLAGVSASILNHTEYGTVSTDADGRFSIPVEGGGIITVIYQKQGLLSVQRKVEVPWNDIANAETIWMIPEDPESTAVAFDGNPDTVYTHRSSEVTDNFGSRSCSMVFTGDNHAYEVDAEGNVISELTTITSRATEYNTSESMPARLPPNSAYTYCVELGVDGIQRVKFEDPVTIWVDNFLGFDVGEIVPVGYYDRDKGVWVPSENGVVVTLLDTNMDGAVDALDADGDNTADDINGNGAFDDEVIGLENPLQYAPNATFWRFSVTHFTPWDCNWPYVPPSDATSSTAEAGPNADEQKDEQKDCITNGSSFVEDRSRIFHEDIPIPGADINLHYASNRVDGYKHVITVPASGDDVPASLKSIIVRVKIAGQVVEQVLDPLPNQRATFTWNGYDYLGRKVPGSATAYIGVGFVYDAVYLSGGDFEMAFAQAGDAVTGVVSRQEVVLWKNNLLPVGGNVNTIAEGWTLSNHHWLSSGDISTLHKGNGVRISKKVNIIKTVAGNGIWGYSGDGGLATEANIGWSPGVTADAAGNLYILDNNHHIVRKVDTTGIITTIAGNGTEGYSGDGGPAEEAQLSWPNRIDVDAAGNLYIVEEGNHCVRKVERNGIITTVAGNGTAGYSGDKGPATEAQLNYPESITVDVAGNLYIADTYNHRVRKVDPNGIITTVAGDATWGYNGDGMFANEAQLFYPRDVAVDAGGNLYIADEWNCRIRKVDASGIISTVAGNGIENYYGDGGPATEAAIGYATGVSVDRVGNLYILIQDMHCVRKVDTSGIITTIAGDGTRDYSGDGGPSTQAHLSWPSGIDVDPAGNLYIADSYVYRIRMVEQAKIYSTAIEAGDIMYPEKELGYIMNSAGRHMETIDLDTGAVLLDFGYDLDKELVSIADQFGNHTIIERDNNGVPTAIISPDGIMTELAIDADNHLTSVNYPNGSYYSFEYTPEGLMTAKTEPEGNRFEHEFDSNGRLTDSMDQEGGHWQFSRTMNENGDILNEVVSAEENLTSYLDHTYSTGAYTSIITGPTGAQTIFTQSADGLSLNKALPCGMNLAFFSGIDSEYGYEFVRQIIESTPEGLEKKILIDKTYQDTNWDDVPDLITKTVTVNDKSNVLENNVLQSQKTVTSPEGRTVMTSYNPSNLLIESINIPNLYEMNFGYDARGRLTYVSTGTRTTTFTYSSEGFLASATDPLGHRTTYEYDPVGRVTAAHRPDGSSLWYTYDGNGNMEVLTIPSNVDHILSYNALNLNDYYQTPLSGGYSYVYDRDRRLIRTNYPSGAQINNIYDKTRLVQIQTPEDTIDYTYLCGTKVGSVTDGTDTVSYNYDGTLIIGEILSGTINQTLSCTYNNDFAINSFDYAGAAESYAYDNDGLLISAGRFSISRNLDNGLPEVVTDGDMALDRTFSGYGEVDEEFYSVAGSGIAAWDVIRDDNGRIMDKTETVVGVTTDYSYTYDSLGRLLTVTKDSVLVEEYQYGDNGARNYEMNALRGITGRTFAYSDEDHLLTAGTVTYKYDLDGFLTAKTDAEEETLYDYSTRGELWGVTLPDGTNIDYVHDPLGRRIAKEVDGTITEKYLWQGLTRLLAVYDGNDNLMMRFEYADGRMPYAMAKGGLTYYLTYDQLGSLRIIADTSGNVVKQIDYDSFGNIITDSNPAFDVPFGFAGGLFDKETGLIRFGYRDYDPEIGRWTAKDPILFAGGDTDLYGYCLNDPVNLIDSLGLKQFEMRIWIGGSIGYAIFGGGIYTATIRDIETGEVTLYNVKALGLGVGFPSFRVTSSRPISFEVDDPCMTSASFKGYGYWGDISAEVGIGIKVGGGIKIPHGPFISGSMIDWQLGGFDVGVSHSITYWSH
ncbi:MAG: hypothetical protein JW743_07250 [Deltaproteobacteria bacterium]|nr:hypothetical protein [Deltaproteobacteria bacterium]